MKSSRSVAFGRWLALADPFKQLNVGSTCVIVTRLTRKLADTSSYVAGFCIPCFFLCYTHERRDHLEDAWPYHLKFFFSFSLWLSYSHVSPDSSIVIDDYMMHITRWWLLHVDQTMFTNTIRMFFKWWWSRSLADDNFIDIGICLLCSRVFARPFVRS